VKRGKAFITGHGQTAVFAGSLLERDLRGLRPGAPRGEVQTPRASDHLLGPIELVYGEPSSSSGDGFVAESRIMRTIGPTSVQPRRRRRNVRVAFDIRVTRPTSSGSATLRLPTRFREGDSALPFYPGASSEMFARL